MSKNRNSSTAKTRIDRQSIQSRMDSFEHIASGKGIADRDKLEGIRPNPIYITAPSARQWLLASGFVQNAIEAPAEDATREWIEIKTNRDEDDPETGQQGLNISRLLLNRMDELNLRQKIREHIKFSRLYNEGSFMFFGVKAELPQDDEQLATPMPQDIRCLDYINVLAPDVVSVYQRSFDPLSKNYQQPSFMVRGRIIDPTRIDWLCNNYIYEEKRGVSVLETILDAIKAQDTALWSVTTLLFEMSAKVFSSDKTDQLDPDELVKFLKSMKLALNTQSSIPLGKDETLTRLQNTGVSDSQLSAAFDFIFENMAGLSRIPKSRLMGQQQGVITGGQYDMMSYYDGIHSSQELRLRPILDRVINMLIREKEGDIYQLLGENVDSLDWEIKFKPLYRIGPSDQADIDLKNAQTDQIYINSTVRTPQQVERQRFDDLEDYPGWTEQPISFAQTPNVTPINQNQGESGIVPESGKPSISSQEPFSGVL